MQKMQDLISLNKEKRSISRIAGATCGLLFCLTTSAFASNEIPSLPSVNQIEISDQAKKTVTITVSDQAGPLIGANVVVKGTTNGNITDFDGKATLQNVPEGSTLGGSYVGYLSKEI